MRRVLLALTAAVVFATASAPASAHRSSEWQVRSSILSSHYGGYCGKGFWTYCYDQEWPSVRPWGPHSYRVTFGHYQERRTHGFARGGLYACNITGVWVHRSGWAGTPSRSCYRL